MKSIDILLIIGSIPIILALINFIRYLLRKKDVQKYKYSEYISDYSPEERQRIIDMFPSNFSDFIPIKIFSFSLIMSYAVLVKKFVNKMKVKDLKKIQSVSLVGLIVAQKAEILFILIFY